MGTQPKRRYIKRVPLTIGLLLISLLGFTASLDFNGIVDDYLFKTISGNGSNGAGYMIGGYFIYMIVGLIAILAIALIWRGIAEWPLPPN